RLYVSRALAPEKSVQPHWTIGARPTTRLTRCAPEALQRAHTVAEDPCAYYGPLPMKIGLVGFPGSGKTTVFNALPALPADTGAGAARGKTNLGVVKVPDHRVDALTKLFQPKKKVYAEVAFSDVAAGAGGGGSARGLDRKVLDGMREVDALCQVVRAFDSDSAPEPPAPMREIRDLEAEMILADLDLVERRLERIKKHKCKPHD